MPERRVAEQALRFSKRVYVRYEKHVSPLTVGRPIHLCEVLGAAPEEIIAPAAIHLWGETETKADLLLASIEKLRTFDEETLRIARRSGFSPRTLHDVLSVPAMVPEQVAGRLLADGVSPVRVCQETIYRFIYGKEDYALELYRNLPEGRRRRRRRGSRKPRDGLIPFDCRIS